jgi:hypothetical protein
MDEALDRRLDDDAPTGPLPAGSTMIGTTLAVEERRGYGLLMLASE